MQYRPEYSLSRIRPEGRRSLLATLLFAGSLSMFASGCEKKEGQLGESCEPSPTDERAGCAEKLVCESVQGGGGKCFAPVLLEGKVFDLLSSAPIADARVVALDVNGAAASSVAVSAADGTYSLQIPTQRSADGAFASADYTLRADASGFQSFPGGIRPALPIKVAGAATETALKVSSPLTAIGLLALTPAPRGTIAGRVEAASRGGVLIDGNGVTAVSDREGNFVLFNVTPGSVTVRGYAAGLQLNPAMVSLAADARVDDVVLTESSTPLSTVSGKIGLADASAVPSTSVLLVLKSTFRMALERGEVPRGLRVGNISGNFTIPNVPDGEYTVLASFENDNGVRDPDPNISGTQIVNITVPAAGGNRSVVLSMGFKVTNALAVRGPGRDEPEAITTPTPMLSWADDSSEDGYQVQVFDAFGSMVWANMSLPRVTGNPSVSVAYGGPALTPGMYYQFRATSIKAGAPISRTEDLRGVFYLPKP